MEIEQKKEIVDFFLKKDILISPGILQDEEGLSSITATPLENLKDILIINKDTTPLSANIGVTGINWRGLEKARVLLEKGKDTNQYGQFISYLAGLKKEPAKSEFPVKVVFSYDAESKKRGVQDFVSFFNARDRS